MPQLGFSITSITKIRALSLALAAGFVLTLAACSMPRTSESDTQPKQSAQQQEAPKPANPEAQDNGRKLGEKAREAEVNTRDERAKLKEDARVAGQKIKQGSQELAAKATAAAKGIREGWNEGKSNPSGKLADINHASASELTSIGLSRAESQSIIAGRPYKTKSDLVTRNVISEAAYRGLEDRITVK